MAPLPEMTTPLPQSKAAAQAVPSASGKPVEETIPPSIEVSRKVRRDEEDGSECDESAPSKRIRLAAGQMSPASSPPELVATPITCVPSSMAASFYQPQMPAFNGWPMPMPVTLPSGMAPPPGLMASPMPFAQQFLLGSGFMRPAMGQLFPMMTAPNAIPMTMPSMFAMSSPVQPSAPPPAVLISRTPARECASVATVDGKVCSSCDTAQTPMWREGYQGMPLCNACGIRFKKYGIQCRHCNYVPRKYERSSVVCRKCQLASAHVVRPIRQRGPNFTFQRDFD